MNAKILEYEEGVIIITADAYMIPELNAIIKKYGDEECLPYLGYVHLMAWPESPHINLPEEDKKENVIFDVTNTLGSFDIDEPLLQVAIDRLKGLFATEVSLMAETLKEEMHKMRKHLQNSSITDDNMKLRADFLRDIEKVIRAYTVVKEQAQKEVETKMRGKSQLGDY